MSQIEIGNCQGMAGETHQLRRIVGPYGKGRAPFAATKITAVVVKGERRPRLYTGDEV